MNCSPAPSFLANSTLETYSQGDIPQASSSCIGCHGNAVSFQPGASDSKAGDVHFNQSDFTFMLEKAQGKEENPQVKGAPQKQKKVEARSRLSRRCRRNTDLK